MLWDEFHQKLMHYIKTMVNNPCDAEDILQEVFIKIFNNIDQVKTPSAVKPWIYKITKNTVMDFYKKKKDITVLPENLDMIEQPLENIDNMNNEIAKCMSNMLFALPRKYQDVYNLHENKEMKHKEIAEELHISVSASKVRLNRTKEMLRKKLLNCCDFEVDKYGNIINYHQKGTCTDCNGKC